MNATHCRVIPAVFFAIELVKTRRFEVETKGNIPGLCDETPDFSVRGGLSFYGVLEMSGDEDHWRGPRGLRRLLEHRVVQAPYEGNEDLYRSLSPIPPARRRARARAP